MTKKTSTVWWEVWVPLGCRQPSSAYMNPCHNINTPSPHPPPPHRHPWNAIPAQIGMHYVACVDQLIITLASFGAAEYYCTGAGISHWSTDSAADWHWLYPLHTDWLTLIISASYRLIDTGISTSYRLIDTDYIHFLQICALVIRCLLLMVSLLLLIYSGVSNFVGIPLLASLLLLFVLMFLPRILLQASRLLLTPLLFLKSLMLLKLWLSSHVCCYWCPFCCWYTFCSVCY